jgi:hypothetical protein
MASLEGRDAEVATMKPKIRAMLNETEQALLRETKRRNLDRLDEDQLIELHARIRRARSKYVKLHRRRGAAQVRKDASRTRAAGAVSKTAVKAEAFEEALALVSARLARAAAESAEALKRERLAAAAAAKGSRSGRPTPGEGKRTKQDPGRSRQRSPIEKKRRASDRATKRRSEAKRAAKR